MNSIYNKIIYTSNRLYNDGLAKAQVRDISGAIACLKKSLELNKKNTQARNLLGLCYLEIGKIKRHYGHVVKVLLHFKYPGDW